MRFIGLRKSNIRKYLALALIIYTVVSALFRNNSVLNGSDIEIKKLEKHELPKSNYQQLLTYPLIVISGFNRSGLNLVRQLLDLHPDVSCKLDTNLISKSIQFIKKFKSKRYNQRFLEDASIKMDYLNSATGIFIQQLFVNDLEERTERLCGKDYRAIQYSVFLRNTFPQIKFIFVVRDGRDLAYSIAGPNNATLFRETLKEWQLFNRKGYTTCKKLGDICLMIKYEELVLHPKIVSKRIFEFLNEENLAEIKLDIKLETRRLWYQNYSGEYVVSEISMLNKLKYPF